MSRRKLPRKVTPKRLRDLLREERERILQRTAPNRGVRRLSTDALRAFVLNEIGPKEKSGGYTVAGRTFWDLETAKAHADDTYQSSGGEAEVSVVDTDTEASVYDASSADEILHPFFFEVEDLGDLGESRVRTVNADELQFIIHSAIRGER